jgi:multidrug resistance efflux pump
VGEDRRLIRPSWVLAALLLVVPLGAVAWWLNRPRPDTGPPPAAGELDVVCLGRIDSLTPIASLDPGVPGRVVKVVAEGAVVKKDDPLLWLDDAAAKLRVEEAMAAVAAAEADRDAAELELRMLPDRKKAQEAAVAAAQKKVDAAEELLKQRRSQQKLNMATDAELAAAEAEVQLLRQLKAAEDLRLAELKAAESGLKVRAAGAKLAAAEVARRQADRAAEECVLKAPSAGVVLRVQASPGEAVAPGSPQPPIVFRPEGLLVVRADLEQEFLGRVRPGMKATVRDEFRPDAPTWTGSVIRVGNWVARKRVVALEPGEIGDVRTVECVVGLDNPPPDLLVGQRVRVRIGRAD